MKVGLCVLFIYVIYVLYYINLHYCQSTSNIPEWIEKRHMPELKQRLRQTLWNLLFLEGAFCFFVAPTILFLSTYLFQSKKTFHFYTTWQKMELIIDNMIQSIDNFDSYDAVLGVDFGGALIADYIHWRYDHIKSKGYIRPHKQRSKISIIFLLQLIYSYYEVTKYIFTFKKKASVNSEPYDTYIRWIDFKRVNVTKVLIVDDGLLSGSTAKACIDYCLNFFQAGEIEFNMHVLHGFARYYKDKLTVYQQKQLVYFPWGQT